MATNAYKFLTGLIKNLDICDDGILMNRKLSLIEDEFKQVVADEESLIDWMEYTNDYVIKHDSSTLAQNFALLIASRKFDYFTIDNTKIRYKMISLLQQNFLNLDSNRKQNINMFYNSVTLLGEYYNRVRQNNGYTLPDLGSALIKMLLNEISRALENDVSAFNIKFAKLILTQITLNGKLLCSSHKQELNELLFQIRYVLINVPNLTSHVKALFLMTLDLFYHKFISLDSKLEEMYEKHLLDLEKFENENLTTPITDSNKECDEKNESISTKSDNVEYISEVKIPKEEKKWSELVDEQSLDSCDSSSSENNFIPISTGNRHTNKKLNSYDDDRRSIRSEDGSLRLYSVHDRMKHYMQSQSPLPNAYNTTYRNRRNSGNSTNDNNYIPRNYNRNNNYNNQDGRNYNTHRQQFNLPPRFTKNFNQHKQNPRNSSFSEHNYFNGQHQRGNYTGPKYGNYNNRQSLKQMLENDDPNNSLQNRNLNRLPPPAYNNNYNRRGTSLERSYISKPQFRGSQNDVRSIDDDNGNNMGYKRYNNMNRRQSTIGFRNFYKGNENKFPKWRKFEGNKVPEDN